MNYLIKSLKWTKHYKKETWWKEDSKGYTDFICNAGIYTEEDKIKKESTISSKDIAFIPITEDLIKKGINQLKKERKKEKEFLNNLRENYELSIRLLYKRCSIIDEKEEELLKFKDFITEKEI